jgi:hypothetical protein
MNALSSCNSPGCFLPLRGDHSTRLLRLIENRSWSAFGSSAVNRWLRRIRHVELYGLRDLIAAQLRG